MPTFDTERWGARLSASMRAYTNVEERRENKGRFFCRSFEVEPGCMVCAMNRGLEGIQRERTEDSLSSGV